MLGWLLSISNSSASEHSPREEGKEAESTLGGGALGLEQQCQPESSSGHMRWVTSSGCVASVREPSVLPQMVLIQLQWRKRESVKILVVTEKRDDNGSPMLRFSAGPSRTSVSFPLRLLHIFSSSQLLGVKYLHTQANIVVLKFQLLFNLK